MESLTWLVMLKKLKDWDGNQKKNIFQILNEYLAVQ